MTYIYVIRWLKVKRFIVSVDKITILIKNRRGVLENVRKRTSRTNGKEYKKCGNHSPMFRTTHFGRSGNL